MARIGTGKILPPPIDLEKELDRGDLQETGFLFSPLMRAVFNFFLKHENGLDRMELALDPGLFSGILHDRNIHIVDTLQAETDKNIVLVYGALHFQ